MKLLIVEDDPAQQRLLAHLARRWDYETAVAATGAEAIALLGAGDVSIAIIDWHLPDMTGIDICRKLGEMGSFIHAIVLSARDADEDVPIALEAGASDYLGKPFQQTELRARLLVGSRMVQLHRRISQMQKLESIGQLAAGVAHEINTPAQFVSDNLRFACESTLDLSDVISVYQELERAVSEGGETRELLEKLRLRREEKELDYILEELPACLEQSLEGITRVADIVRAMKSFSHPGSTQQTMVDLNDSIASTITVARYEWRSVARVETELDASLPTVAGYPGELNQVLLNLLVNAAHAVGERYREDPEQGSIRISTRRSGDWVVVSIADNGSGIPERVLDRIFDPFFTTKEVGKGTGQGLAIAYDVVVRKHQGKLRVETEPDVGTTFLVELPIGEAATG